MGIAKEVGEIPLPMSLSDKPLVGRWCVGFGMGRLSEVTFPFVVRLS